MRLNALAALYRVDLRSTETPANPPTPLWLLAGPTNRDRRRATALRASVDQGMETLEHIIGELSVPAMSE
jgi:hypothetical protein